MKTIYAKVVIEHSEFVELSQLVDNAFDVHTAIRRSID
jgi:hypothetical protein